MIAAIYGRKTTEQNGADADAKSVARQVENRAPSPPRRVGRSDAHVYTDDAISGAETRKLVNRQRLLDEIRSGAAVSGAHHARRGAVQPSRRRRGLRRVEGASRRPGSRSGSTRRARGSRSARSATTSSASCAPR